MNYKTIYINYTYIAYIYYIYIYNISRKVSRLRDRQYDMKHSVT